MRGQRSAYAIHSWTGLLTGWLLFVICLTGTLVVYKYPLKALSNPGFVRVAQVERLSADDALAAFQRVHPDAKVTMLAFPGDVYSIDQYSLKAKIGDAKDKRYWVSPDSGEVREELESDFADFIQRLHANLFLGHEGQWFVGLLGVTMAVSLIAGLWFHWPHIRRDLFHLRLGAHRRKAWSDLHKFASVWSLPFLLVISVTGAWLGLETVIHIPPGDSKPIELKGEGAGAPLPVSQIVARARALRPDFTPTHVNFQNYGAGGASIRVQGDLPGHRLVQRGQTMLVFNADTGAHLQTIDRTEQGFGRRILSMVRPLHYGYFAPPIGEIAYLVFGFACTLVVGSGLFIWAERERRKAHPRNPTAVTGMERANAGVMGGLLLALAFMALLHGLARLDLTGELLAPLGNMRFLGGQNFSSAKPIAPEMWAFLAFWLGSAIMLARINPLTAWRHSLRATAAACVTLIALTLAPIRGTELAAGPLDAGPVYALVCAALALAAWRTARRLHANALSPQPKA